MAEQDQATKTEQPTERRLREARDRGQVAVSQDLRTWAVLCGTALFAAFLVPALAQRLAPVLAHYLDISGTAVVSATGARVPVADVLIEAGLALAPAIALVLLLAVAAGVVQAGLVWAPARIQPKLDHLSPAKGLERMFSITALIEFAKGLAKLGLVAAVALLVAWPLLDDVRLMPAWPVIGGLGRLQELAAAISAATAAVMAVVALLDYAYQRHKHMRELRMSRQEVRDEYRQSEGDPHVKARIKRLRSERARHRMMAAVPKADVVVTNPTHYAVALAYDPAAMAAPRVVAKGVDAVAFRIREVADEAGVPIMQNPPLARSLYAAVELDREIPTEHYQAVAEVIAYVMRERTAGASAGGSGAGR